MADGPVEISWEKLQDILGDEPIELGSGGFGVVHAGTYNGIPVAVKVGDALRDINKEAQYTKEKQYLDPRKSNLKHEHLIELKGYGEKKDFDTKGKKINHKLWLVYELMSSTLTDKLEVLTWKQTHEILVQTAMLLAYIHKKEVVHNDIKPENILIDNAFNVRVADFGSAARVGEKVTVATPAYEWPRKTRGHSRVSSASKPADKRDDVYAFGTTMLQLLMKEGDPGQPKDNDGHGHDRQKRKETRNEKRHISLEAADKAKRREGHVLSDLLTESKECKKNRAIEITELALQCCSEEPPDMNKVVERLETMK